MLHEQDDHQNDKFIKLVKKVKTLSKIVNELEAEVDDLKSRLLSEKKDAPIRQESQIAESDGSKLNRFQRLNIFRKSNKTKERVIDSKTDKSENPRTTDDGNVNSEVHFKTTPTIIDRRQQTANQRFSRETVNDQVNSNRRSRSTQSVSFPKEMEFSCIVRTCAVQTENNIGGSVSSQENMAVEPTFNMESACKGCHKTKKSKLKKSKAGRCAKNCPYLRKDNGDDKKKKKKYKSKKTDASLETCYEDRSHLNKKRKCEDKEAMTNFTKINKSEGHKFICNNDNFSIDGKLFECLPRTIEVKNNAEPRTALRLSDHDGKSTKVKETHCKRCFKKCKTKNVLKINKAILTHDPPVILMSPCKF